MTNYNDIITNMAVTNYYSGVYYEMTEEEKALFQDVYNWNDVAISNWLGLAGDTFKQLAGTIEIHLADTLRFTGNCYETTDQTYLNAARIDQDVMDSINIGIAEEQ